MSEKKYVGSVKICNWRKVARFILDFKLSPSFECCM